MEVVSWSIIALFWNGHGNTRIGKIDPCLARIHLNLFVKVAICQFCLSWTRSPIVGDLSPYSRRSIGGIDFGYPLKLKSIALFPNLDEQSLVHEHVNTPTMRFSQVHFEWAVGEPTKSHSVRSLLSSMRVI